MDERSSTITLEQARNGSPVPVINGVYLHSIYDPEKEAQAFVETFSSQLQQKNHILILGLALGYHIQKIETFLREHHGDYKITVLETNSEMIRLCSERHQFDESKVSIIHLADLKTLYAQRSFVDFLMQKPCILKHEASFGVNKTKYTEFLTYKSNRKTSSYIDQLSETTKDLIAFNPEIHLNQMGAEIKSSGKITDRSQFLALALDEIIKRDQVDQGEI